LDPLTGDICFTATTNVITATGIKVEEWRTINGTPTLIGTVYRDIQLKVDYCNNHIPTLSGMDTLNTHTYHPNDTTYAIEMCLGPTVSFDINGHDSDVYNPANIGHPEVFHISWNQGIPQGTFTTYYNGTDSAYAHFSWTPTSADVSNVPKCFTATIHDEACPYYGSQTFSYCITVRGMLVDIGSDTLLCTGDTLTIFADADTTTVNYIWKWNGQSTGTPQSQNYYFINTNNYGPGIDTLTIETNDGNTTMQCPGRDKIIVQHVYQPHINGTLADSAFCDGGSVTYDAGQGTNYLWMRLFPNTFVGASQTLKIDTTGVYTVFVDGGNNTRCTDQDTFTINVIPNPNLGPDTCDWLSNGDITLDPGNYPGVLYEWSDGSTGKTLNVNTSGTYSVSFSTQLNPNVKCSDDVDITILDKSNFIVSAMVNASDDSPSESPVAGDRKICTHQRLKLEGPQPPSQFTYNYQWSKNNSNISNSQYFILKETEEGSYTIALNVNGCQDKITVETEHCLVEPPNVITPYNVDGKNDVFKIDGLENFPDSKLEIYNRWGKRIFVSNNYQNDWDGGGAADGVNYWILYLQDGRGTTMKGTVTIISK
jgi:gliding motility-associated-like protein